MKWSRGILPLLLSLVSFIYREISSAEKSIFHAEEKKQLRDIPLMY